MFMTYCVHSLMQTFYIWTKQNCCNIKKLEKSRKSKTHENQSNVRWNDLHIWTKIGQDDIYPPRSSSLGSNLRKLKS